MIKKKKIAEAGSNNRGWLVGFDWEKLKVLKKNGKK